MANTGRYVSSQRVHCTPVSPRSMAVACKRPRLAARSREMSAAPLCAAGNGNCAFVAIGDSFFRKSCHGGTITEREKERDNSTTAQFQSQRRRLHKDNKRRKGGKAACYILQRKHTGHTVSRS